MSFTHSASDPGTVHVPFAFRMSADENARIDREAERSGHSKAAVLRGLINLLPEVDRKSEVGNQKSETALIAPGRAAPLVRAGTSLPARALPASDSSSCA